jgi:hypothetical protein
MAAQGRFYPPTQVQINSQWNKIGRWAHINSPH